MPDLKGLKKSTQGIFDIQLSTIDSSNFIQSQKEYSICLVAEKEYSGDEIEDMSYFHFLSAKSMIFDLVGQSNFQYEEVRALGVGIVEHEILLNNELESSLNRIHEALKDL